MTQKIDKISSSRIDLPKSWKGSRVVIQYPNKDTLLIKRLSSEKGSDFDMDERIWKDLEPTARKVRSQVFREFYPSLYEASKKSSKKTI